ncbi:MAG: transcriptional regulator [Verrucomicrobia bacterium]|nr:transcriptional regulator [Verrucomicrobiota bacterium]
MLNDYSDDRLRLVARLYYLDGLGQSEVARFAKVSQAKVSRLLALARERGIVRITVADYEPRRRELEDQLRARLGLKEAMVIKAGGGTEAADVRRAVGHFGADAVDALIQPRDIVALAGGRTIHDLVHHLPQSRTKSLTVVQAMGSVDSNVSVFDAQEIGRVMAQRLGGIFLALNAPAFIAEKRTRDALLALEQVRSVDENLERANVALVGLGTLQNSVFVERGVLKEPMIAELERAGAVGEVCGRFIDADGRECETAWSDRVMSVRVEQLRRIPRVIGVVSGSDRTAAILAAIRGGLIKSLVIDEGGAGVLLATASNSATASVAAKPKRKTKK